jgi:hypothetical protein
MFSTPPVCHRLEGPGSLNMRSALWLSRYALGVDAIRFLNSLMKFVSFGIPPREIFPIAMYQDEGLHGKEMLAGEFADRERRKETDVAA